jgi:hypothetical protein
LKSFNKDEAIQFYVAPGEFLEKKFNEQWERVTEIELDKAKMNYRNLVEDLKKRLSKYFSFLLKEVRHKSI